MEQHRKQLLYLLLSRNARQGVSYGPAAVALKMAGQKGENMKKVFNMSGEFLGAATKIEKLEKGIQITFRGDFPGMSEKTLVYMGGRIVYEDENRLYIEY